MRWMLGCGCGRCVSVLRLLLLLVRQSEIVTDLRHKAGILHTHTQQQQQQKHTLSVQRDAAADRSWVDCVRRLTFCCSLLQSFMMSSVARFSFLCTLSFNFALCPAASACASLNSRSTILAVRA